MPISAQPPVVGDFDVIIPEEMAIKNQEEMQEKISDSEAVGVPEAEKPVNIPTEGTTVTEVVKPKEVTGRPDVLVKHIIRQKFRSKIESEFKAI